MYAIKWTRCTGENGQYSTTYKTYSQALGAVQALLMIDKVPHAYKYEIIEIG